MSADAPVSIHVGSVGVWAFLAVLMHLGGVYLGGVFGFLRFFALIAPVLSVTYVLIVRGSLRYQQEFSTEHPAKGESVRYRCELANEGSVPAGPVSMLFRVGGGDMPELSGNCTLGPGGRYTLEHEVRCPYRGVYTVGLSELRIADPLGLITIRPEVWYRTFYVYPRVLQLSAGFARTAATARTAEVPTGIATDYTRPRGLAEYREGMEARHIAWKKFAQYGRPLVREYEVSSAPGLTIVVDTRPTRADGRPDPAAEDVSVEAAVSLAGRCVELNIPVSILADGLPDWWIRSRRDLDRIRARSVGVFFQSGREPMELLGSRRSGVIAITHRFQTALQLAEGNRSSGRGEPALRVVVNACSATSEEYQALLGLRNREGLGGSWAVVRQTEELDREVLDW